MKTCTGCRVSKHECDYSPARGKLQSKCKRCYAALQADWRLRNHEKVIAQRLVASETKSWRRYYLRNKDKESRRKAEYYAANTAVVRARNDSYHQRNPHVRTAITAKRRATLLQATPSWANHEVIKALYREAAERSEPCEVDHLYPLQGETVCGLHVESNLRVLPKGENRSKGNALPACAA